MIYETTRYEANGARCCPELATPYDYRHEWSLIRCIWHLYVFTLGYKGQVGIADGVMEAQTDFWGRRDKCRYLGTLDEIMALSGAVEAYRGHWMPEALAMRYCLTTFVGCPNAQAMAITDHAINRARAIQDLCSARVEFWNLAREFVELAVEDHSVLGDYQEYL